jgi:hypothetical protein
MTTTSQLSVGHIMHFPFKLIENANKWGENYSIGYFRAPIVTSFKFDEVMTNYMSVQEVKCNFSVSGH